MGNLESTDGGPGEPPSVPLLLPPGKTPMPEPCELEERFALVLVRPALLPSRRPPTPRRVPPTPAALSMPDRAGSSERPVGGRGGGVPKPGTCPRSRLLPPHFPQTSRSAARIPFPGPRRWDVFGSCWVPSQNEAFFLPYESGSRVQTRCFGEERGERRRGWLPLGVGGGIRSDAILLISEPPAGILLSCSGFA